MTCSGSQTGPKMLAGKEVPTYMYVKSFGLGVGIRRKNVSMMPVVQMQGA